MSAEHFECDGRISYDDRKPTEKTNADFRSSCDRSPHCLSPWPTNNWMDERKNVIAVYVVLTFVPSFPCIQKNFSRSLFKRCASTVTKQTKRRNARKMQRKKQISYTWTERTTDRKDYCIAINSHLFYLIISRETDAQRPHNSIELTHQQTTVLNVTCTHCRTPHYLIIERLLPCTRAKEWERKWFSDQHQHELFRRMQKIIDFYLLQASICIVHARIFH